MAGIALTITAWKTVVTPTSKWTSTGQSCVSMPIAGLNFIEKGDPKTQSLYREYSWGIGPLPEGLEQEGESSVLEKNKFINPTTSGPNPQ